MIINFYTFNEMYSFDKNIKVRIQIDDSEHYIQRQSRLDNEPDIKGETIVSSDEIKADIIKSLDELLLLNLYGSKVYWDKDKLNKNILCQNSYTNLNVIYSVSKIKENVKYIYNIDIITVMRKKDFITSKSMENTTFKIILK